MRLSVSEAAALTGVSVRTLHYYDQIGLLCPSETSSAGYRYYDADALRRLQEILFFRELNFSLSEIRELTSLPGYSRKKALKKQKKLLQLQEKRLKAIIGLVENAIKGENIMSFSAFQADGFDKAKEKFADEAKEKWGSTDAYKESEQKHAALSPKEKQAVMDDMDSLILAFSKQVGADAADPKVQKLVKKWQQHITDNHYRCTDEILQSLGDMYVGDPRFTQNLDRFAPGTAQLISDAIALYTKKNKA